MATEASRNSRVMFAGTLATVLECLGDDRLLLDVPGHDPVIASQCDVMPIADRLERFSTALESIPAAEWRVVSERAEVLRELLSFGKVTGPRLRDAARRLNLSTRQVNRLLRKFETTQTTTTLLPEASGCPPDALKLGEEKERVIASFIDDFYLQKERPRIADLHAKVAREFRRLGWPVPCFQTVRRRVELRDPKDLDRARLGSKQARLRHSPVPGHVNVQAPLERVEIDHTLMNVIVRSDDPTSDFRARPTITIAVDVFTRCVLGFHIGFEPPSAMAVALCLAHSVFPKDPKATHGTDIDWPMHGLMKSIVVDNGKDFRSEAFRRGCMQYGILLGYRPVGSPHYGGVIERLIGTFMRRTEVLPGTTKSNVVEKGEYDAVGKATLTLSQLRKWMVAQVAAYHASQHRMLRQPPASMWVQPEPVPVPDARTFLLDFLPGDMRTLSRTGVDMHCLQYWSDDFAVHSTRKPRVRVTFDPRDIGVVYVRLPDGKLTTARVTRRDVPTISLAEWEMRRAHERAIAADPTYVQARDEADDFAESIVAEAAVTKKLRRRQETQAAGDPLRAESTGVSADSRAVAPMEKKHASDPVSALLGGLRAIETPYFEVLDND